MSTGAVKGGGVPEPVRPLTQQKSLISEGPRSPRARGISGFGEELKASSPKEIKDHKVGIKRQRSELDTEATQVVLKKMKTK